MENWLVAVDMERGTPEAEATFRCQLEIMKMKGEQTSAKCKLFRKPHANLPDSPVALAGASKYLQMLLGPPKAVHHALRLCKSIRRFSL